ncbi:MAG: 16S rRNA (guanine(966)-N(2))-methyltransferase RsmD [Chloroflexota bacterium]|nr:16S rRNA (guanine(966)-N(2))-methyltransferase RsmD [Chloroflexota bacterium]MDE2840165.1 16S rRNA (guanine(966)-N(2))-methyltransferase RsmD [Chloroflexota bacterium]MDE2930609.1 16S rRNA (guanine(966)-N(2))-methyltransferase RsmD [Chloroflexota bacterium]
MRIISGTAAGRRLRAPKSQLVRPTLDKVKHAIFNSLGESGGRGRVLELFAGTGALGIEALSRGAEWCDFVDVLPASCRAIRENLRTAGLKDRARVIQARVPGALGRLREPYDLVLADPPYHTVNHEDWLPALAESEITANGSIVVVGHWKKKLPDAQWGGLRLLRRRQHGDSMFSIYAVEDV